MFSNVVMQDSFSSRGILFSFISYQPA